MFCLYPSHLLIFPCTKVYRNIIYAVLRNKFFCRPNCTEQQIKNWKIYRCVHMYLYRTFNGMVLDKRSGADDNHYFFQQRSNRDFQ